MNRVSVRELCGNRMMRGFKVTSEEFDYGYSIGICVAKNQRHAFRFSARQNLTVGLRRKIRRTLEACKAVAARRYVPKKSRRRAGMVLR